MVDKRLMDVESALGRLMGSTTLYKRLLNKFLVSADFDALRESVKAGDNKRCDEISHAIKGVAGNLSLTALFEVSSTLMVQFRGDNPNPETIDSFWVIKEDTFAAINAYLAE